ncbi:MAG: hypothetical protein QW607_06100 [Desulfurococcaceae archaeon]
MGSCSSYKKWKILVLLKLIELSNKTADQETRKKIIELIDRLQYVKLRDIYSILKDLFELTQKYPDLYQLIPRYDQALEWISKGKKKTESS